ncbi:MAG: prolyl oligopeptidase family serine peptidase, partial [Candidatus Hodarchaeales archaeon]
MTSNNDLIRVAYDYPRTKTETIKEEIHGVVIKDDYRWLENTNNKEVRNWIKEQNNHAESILKRIPGRSVIYDRLVQLHDYEEVFLPKERVNGWFYRRRQTDEQQPVLYFRPKIGGVNQEKKLVDVNEIDPSGLTSLDWFFPSEDGKLLAYGISKDGSEWSVLHILDIETGKHLRETIERTRYSTVIWKKDKTGFYYTRFPSLGEVPDGEEFYHIHLRYHELGTDPANDPVIFENSEKPFEIPGPIFSPDESFILVSSSSFQANDIFKIDLNQNQGPPSITPIVTGGKWQIITHIGENYIYFLSNKDSSKYAVYRAPIDEPLPENWECIIEPGESVIEQFTLAGRKIVIVRLHDVAHEMLIYDLEGNLERQVAIPENSTILDKASGRLSGRIDSNTIYYTHQTFFDPVSIHSCNVETGETCIFYNTEIKLDTDHFKVVKKWYPSKDETMIHMFILQRDGTLLDGKNPVILYGYGGFNVNLTPIFSPIMIKWLELGGIFAIANLRGGGEFGEDWHDAGKLEKKQNVFD